MHGLRNDDLVLLLRGGRGARCDGRLCYYLECLHHRDVAKTLCDAQGRLAILFKRPDCLVYLGRSQCHTGISLDLMLPTNVANNVAN